MVYDHSQWYPPTGTGRSPCRGPPVFLTANHLSLTPPSTATRLGTRVSGSPDHEQPPTTGYPLEVVLAAILELDLGARDEVDDGAGD